VRTVSLSVGQWLLMLIEAPDALVGDLYESAPARSVGWYWSEWCRIVLLTVQSSARRRPLRAWWIGLMTMIAAIGGVQVIAALLTPCEARTVGAQVHRHVWRLKHTAHDRAVAMPTPAKQSVFLRSE
jgi:hypothetical protein